MTTMNLTARQHESRVLRNWAATRDGADQRMGIVNSQKFSTARPEELGELFNVRPAASGYAVTDRTAMLVSTVYACLSKLGGAHSQLPIEKFRLKEDGDREQQKRDEIWYLLNEQPAATWTAASWKEWIVRCVALRGDQHTEILRSKAARSLGEIVGFKVHHPDYSHARRLNGRLVYDVQDRDTGHCYTVDQDDMLHFAGAFFDGERSLSMIQSAARSGIGNALAAADYTGRSIGEGAMPQIALEYANRMTPQQKTDLRESFDATYGSSPDRNGRKVPLVLTEGGKANVLGISPVDMDLLASRRFEREDIYQAIGVPGVMIGDNDKTSSWGTGIEQITLGFVKYTLKPHLRRWAEELNRKVYRRAGPFLEYNLDELLRGDSKAQGEADRSALGGPGSGHGYKTVNEVRRSRNMPRVDGGDELFKADPKAVVPAPKEKEPA